jgi:hypothetical protein
MANLKDSNIFRNYDDYYTPKSAWEQINHLIPKDKIIWEAFCLNANKSKSAEYLTELGNKVVYDTNMDMLENEPEKWDMIISNPPFNTKIKLQILKRLVELDKPFILILNSLNTFAKYIRDIFKDKFNDLQIITPSNKIHFIRLNEDNTLTYTKTCSFYSVYLCYKMNLSNEQLWLI